MPKPPQSLIIALAQLNPHVGDVIGNLTKARRARAQAAALKADVIVFSELFIAGYPPEDLVLRPAFQRACREAAEALALETVDGGPAVLIGLPWAEAGGLYNAVALLDQGRIEELRFKVELPNYGVFDEKRVFASGPLPDPVTIRGIRVGVPICEDIWNGEVCAYLARAKAEMLLVPNGSPYWRGKIQDRLNVVRQRVQDCDLPLVYLNQVGGQDELVFDGASFIVQPDGACVGELPAFEEVVVATHWQRIDNAAWMCVEAPRGRSLEAEQADYSACVLGLRDYVEKNRFPGVVLGLSGGIDSALCAAMAVDALGAERVHAIMLPYRFTSSESLEDAQACAKALGLRYDTLPIHQAVEGLEQALKPLFQGRSRDLTEENLQSRARGTILMSISNKFGPMVVTTGNKSEMSVGYATIYGDMNGGFNPIKDLYKMEVYALSHLRNQWKPTWALGLSYDVIPERILTKAPSAELRENQRDEDSLPPYPILDAILKGLIEEDASCADLVAQGYPKETVQQVEGLLMRAEYKRRQSAPGVKVTRRSFGRDWRYPITHRFRDFG